MIIRFSDIERDSNNNSGGYTFTSVTSRYSYSVLLWLSRFESSIDSAMHSREKHRNDLIRVLWHSTHSLRCSCWLTFDPFIQC